MDYNEFVNTKRAIESHLTDGVSVLTATPDSRTERLEMEIYVRNRSREAEVVSALSSTAMGKPEGPLVLASDRAYGGNFGGYLMKLVDMRLPDAERLITRETNRTKLLRT